MAKKACDIPIMERIEKHTASKAEAKRLYNLVEGIDFVHMTMTELMGIKGLGRKSVHVLLDVVLDINGKKP